MIKIDFSIDTKYGIFKDALYLEDNHTLTEADISNIQNQRVENWINAIENASNQNEEIIIDGIQYEKIEINGNTVLKPIGD